jgi:hypothetical protein
MRRVLAIVGLFAAPAIASECRRATACELVNNPVVFIGEAADVAATYTRFIIEVRDWCSRDRRASYVFRHELGSQPVTHTVVIKAN